MYDPNDFIERIKQLASELKWSNDWLSFHRELSELEWLVWRLDQIVMQPAQAARRAKQIRARDQDLEELFKEMHREMDKEMGNGDFSESKAGTSE